MLKWIWYRRKYFKVKNITEDGLQYTSIEVDDKIAFEIDSKKGLYDSEASNKFRKTPPSGDNLVEIITIRSFKLKN